ncbi:unnamed protein product [Adineta steineri]|uniref:GH3 auxin-responsive promoter n=2 Tax=Adineta steineri TaxID=433720 RepID=A0A818LKC4_9BILA|nr:unnamed protein product [Adineta steineri]
MWLWTWFLNTCLSIYRYFLIKYKGHKFDHEAKISIEQKTNRQTLFNILKQNQNTKFLIDQRKKCQIDQNENIDSVEKFKKLFPKFTEYSDYKSYVDEIRNDGHTKDILSIGFPIALTSTSGTSGDPKNFPIYSLDINEPYNIAYMMTKTVPSNLFNGCKSISLNNLSYEIHTTKDKLKTYKVSAITTIAAGEKQNVETILRFNQDIVPSIVFYEIKQQNDKFLFILIWALQCKDLEVLSSTFVMALIHFLTFMEEKFDFICKHIELGTIPVDESLSVPLSVDVRLALQSPQYRLPPNPNRAEELRKIVNENGFHHVTTHFWPNLKCGICIISPSIRQFESKLLSTYWDPKVPIYPYVYGMSEHHRIAVPLKPNAYDLIPQPRSVFYEFIEVEDDDEKDEDDEQTLESFELHQVEEGKRYEVVFTTYDGLYRYRTQDIIKIVGRYYSLPTWHLIGRRGQYLSVSNEHVTELELREIINSILREYEKEFTSVSPQYSVFIDKSSYVLSIEVDDEKQDDKDQLKQIGKELSTKLDEKLKESNEDYKTCREKKKISSPTILWLKYNTLTTGIRDFRLDPNKSGSINSKAQKDNQLKSQMILKRKKDNDTIKFVKENIVLQVN